MRVLRGSTLRTTCLKMRLCVVRHSEGAQAGLATLRVAESTPANSQNQPGITDARLVLMNQAQTAMMVLMMTMMGKMIPAHATIALSD